MAIVNLDADGDDGDGAALEDTQHLVALHQRGDRSAFDRLFLRHEAVVRRYIMTRAGAAAGADFGEEDLVQEVWQTAWRLLPRFVPRGVGSFGRWLRVIARRVLSDRRKYKGATQRPRPNSLDVGGSETGGDGIADTATSPSAAAARREDREALLEAIAKLPGDERIICKAILFDEQSLRDLATRLGMSKSTVWNRFKSGMTRLEELP